MMVFDITDIGSFEDIANKFLPEVTHYTGVSCN